MSGPGRRRWLAPVIGVLILGGLLVVWFLRGKLLSSGGRFSAKRNLLVITLDTIRADRLGAYGNREVETPSIDSLAARGTLFEHALATAPLTLPSHTSLFTGTYPAFHGVRDNGDFVVPSDLTTMAQLFQARGYHTGAFVGAFVLDRRWGLNRGFDEYSDEFNLHQEVISVGDIRRPGNQVVDRALAWMARVGEGPFLAWIHLYDPHMPYDPPADFQQRYPERPYLAEIAFADSQIGRVLRYLDTAGLRKRTAIVFAGDHGESLDDHQETEHGFFVYQQTLRVPLIISDPAAGIRGSSRRRETVSLVDVLPTITDLYGLPLPGDVQGRSLGPLLGRRGQWKEAPVYGETYYPNLHFGWGPLKTIVERRYQFIDSADPELYDLEEDPQESRNLLDERKELLRPMKKRLDDLVARIGRNAKQARQAADPETVAKLASLGYLSGSSAPRESETASLPSPRSKIGIYNHLIEAHEKIGDGDFAAAERLLVEVIRSDPDVNDAYSSLGNLRLKERRYAEASKAFERALERRPDDSVLVTSLARSQLLDQRPQDAEKTVEKALKVSPEDPRLYLLLAKAAEVGRNTTEAVQAYERARALDPRSAVPYAGLAAIFFQKGDLASCETNARKALSLDPKIEEAHLWLGQIREKEGRTEEALAEYQREAEQSPKDFRAVYASSLLYRKLGRTSDEEKALRMTIDRNPDFPMSYLHLAKLWMDRGERYSEAIGLVRRAMKQPLQRDDLAFGYFLLADLYSRVGDRGQSEECLRKGRQIEKGRNAHASAPSPGEVRSSAIPSRPSGRPSHMG